MHLLVGREKQKPLHMILALPLISPHGTGSYNPNPAAVPYARFCPVLVKIAFCRISL